MDPKILYLLFGAVIFLVILALVSLFILIGDIRKVNNKQRDVEELMKDIEYNSSRGSSHGSSKRSKRR